MKKGIVTFLLIAATGFLPEALAGNGSNSAILVDTARVGSLNKLAEKLLKNDQYDSSLIYATQAFHISDSLLRLNTVKSNPAYFNVCKMMKVRSMSNMSGSLRNSSPNYALDTLKSALKLAKETGSKNLEARIYADMGEVYSSISKDKTALVYQLRSVSLLRETGNQKELAWQLTAVGITQRILGNYGDAMEYFMESLKISRSIGDSSTTIEALLAIGFTYAFVERWDDALKFQRQALEIYSKENDSSGIARIYNDMGVTNMNAGKLEVALAQHRQALAIRLKSSEKYYTFASYLYIGEILERLNRLPEAIQSYENALNFTQYSAFKISAIDGEISLGKAYLKLPDYPKALKTLTSAHSHALEIKDMPTQAEASLYIAKIYLARENPRLALAWLRKAEKAASGSSLVYLADIYQSIAETYFKLNDFRNAFLNQQKYSMVKDSLGVSENLEKIATLSKRLDFENKQALQNQEHEKKFILSQADIRREKIIRNFSLSGMLLAIVLMVVAFVRYLEKKKLNNRLSETLVNLKTTQSQLIQSEKMASLGELAAGISHEIQNPLNFVNNFSEVSKELIVEAQGELAGGNYQLAKEILDDVEENLDKINHHGKRADSIIKGMLQHSRSSPGAKEPTDINALTDEFLRLAYHGLRAREKSFNATMETDFDSKLGKVNVIPQDMGRVILNLITNAFYAVNEKRISGAENYQPLVKVSTRQTNDKVMVLIYDNGNGIPQQALEKIFQPFFTTKPAGEGTGLGLSMSYDIVTKGHGGELKVKTSPGHGTTFTIVIPV
jgi:signal transduction histidine kinase